MSAETPRYINRELSWLEFNQRVLDEARNEANPLLERMKFLAITSSNLDEFFMVRVGGLQLLAEEGSARTDPAGMTAGQQLEAISTRAHQLLRDQYVCLLEELEPALAAEGIVRHTMDTLNVRQAEAVRELFERELFPVLSPQSIVPHEPFPLLSRLSLHVCVRLSTGDPETPNRFAMIPLGKSLSRIMALQAERGHAYILLDDVVRHYLSRFFPEVTVLESATLRITRNADMGVREDMTGDLLHQMQDVLDARLDADCVRLEVSSGTSREMRSFLQQAFSVGDSQTYQAPGPLELSVFMKMTSIAGYDHLKNEPWKPVTPVRVEAGESMLKVISQGDLLLYHPYESFEPVIRLIEQAADDPEVLAIKQTLYRTSGDSPLVAALMRAASRGKYVTAIVELKARFDEARNIEWAQNLEKAGVQVIYGIKKLKTHAKLCIIVRREPQGIQRYMHFGTGNYNEATSRLYSDASYFTCNEELGADASAFFNSITGNTRSQRLHKLEAAPLGLRDKLLEMIDTEIERKRHGQQASITAKVNSLADPAITEALYAASAAGVKVKLNIRGICTLRPGVPGLSENITVVSVVDRYLEHARILHFRHGGDHRVFISSADWMGRNLDRRIELLVPIDDVTCRNELMAILKTYFQDNQKGRRLLPDGTYEKLTGVGADPIRSQEVLYHRFRDRVDQAARSRLVEFEPHRAPEQEEL